MQSSIMMGIYIATLSWTGLASFAFLPPSPSCIVYHISRATMADSQGDPELCAQMRHDELTALQVSISSPWPSRYRQALASIDLAFFFLFISPSTHPAHSVSWHQIMFVSRSPSHSPTSKSSASARSSERSPSTKQDPRAPSCRRALLSNQRTSCAKRRDYRSGSRLTAHLEQMEKESELCGIWS